MGVHITIMQGGNIEMTKNKNDVETFTLGGSVHSQLHMSLE